MADSGQKTQLAASRIGLRSLLAVCKPATLLATLQEINDFEEGEESALLRVQALIELDRYSDAERFLREKLASFRGPTRIESLCLWAQINLRLGAVDAAVLTALQAAQESVDNDWRAIAMSWAAAGYAKKNCLTSAEDYLQEALKICPNDSRILAIRARVSLDSDQRDAANTIYERLRLQPDLWGRVIGAWGESYVAYLMGEFDRAWEIGLIGLDLSPEVVLPGYVLAQISLARNDLDHADHLLRIISERSPFSDGLESLREEFDLLRARGKAGNQNGKRLISFPSLVQRRDYCGPSTVELVLRYWQTDLRINNDQIADWVKNPRSGSPMYKMSEFFHLMGYDTVRTLLPAKKLKQCINLGIPVIIQEVFSNSSHVVVVIGYDELNRKFDIQDPMTHLVITVDEDELRRRREIFLESGLIAYPRRLGLGDSLAASGIFDLPSLLWTDQAVIELDKGDYQRAIGMLVKSVQRTPSHAFSWIMLLYAWLEIWKEAASSERAGVGEGYTINFESETLNLPEIRRRFYEELKHAKENHSNAAFINQLRGQAKVIEGKFEIALRSFAKAVKLDPENPALYASMAECYYALRDPLKALNTARRCLELEPSFPDGNAWMARSLTIMGRGDASFYARAAVEVNEDGWLGFLALAEDLIRHNEFNLAYDELQTAQRLNPGMPEIDVQLANLALHRGDFGSVGRILSELRRSKNPVKPSTKYLISKILCQLEFEQENYKAAEESARILLESFPQDSWGLQFLAAAASECLISTRREIDQEQLQSFHTLFEQAVQVNEGDLEVIEMYVNYLNEIVDISESLRVLDNLIKVYEESSGSLLYLKSQLIDKTGATTSAASVLKLALKNPGAIRNLNQLEEACRILISGLGPEETAHLVISELKDGNYWTNLSLNEIERSLGLELVSYHETRSIAYDLLHRVFQRNSQDPEVLLGLGIVSPSDSERESFYRQALLSRSEWPEAREMLVDFLFEHNRIDEVKNFTSGYEHLSNKLSLSHGRALSAKGFYEQSVPFFIAGIERNPDLDKNVYLQLWDVEIRCGWFAKAQNLAEKISGLNKHDPLWQLRIAIPLLESLNFEQAFAVFQRAVNLGLNEIDQLRFDYRVSCLQENYSEALECLQRLLTHTPQTDNSQSLNWVEIEIFKILAVLEANEMIWDFGNSKHLDAAGWADAAGAVLLGDSSHLAVKLAQKSLSIDENNRSGLNILGSGLYELGQIQDSFSVFQAMRSDYPSEHSPYEYLALQAILDGKLNQAYELADRAVRLGAYCPHAWAVRGLVNFFLYNNQEACSDLTITWNRLDTFLRSKKPAYWAVLSHLHQKKEETIYWTRLASRRKGDTFFVETITRYFDTNLP